MNERMKAIKWIELAKEGAKIGITDLAIKISVLQDLTQAIATLTSDDAEEPQKVDGLPDFEDALEEAFWNFDHLHKRDQSHPSERDAFKMVLRALFKRGIDPEARGLRAELDARRMEVESLGKIIVELRSHLAEPPKKVKAIDIRTAIESTYSYFQESRHRWLSSEEFGALTKAVHALQLPAPQPSMEIEEAVRGDVFMARQYLGLAENAVTEDNLKSQHALVRKYLEAALAHLQGARNAQ